MVTGIKISDEAVKKYNQLKIKKTLRYVVFGMADDLKSVVPLSEGARDATFEDFLKEFPEKEPRYVVMEYEFEKKYGDDEDQKRDASRLVLIYWCPSKAKVRSKMIYSGTLGALNRKLEGIHVKIEASDFSDIEEEKVKQQQE